MDISPKILNIYLNAYKERRKIESKESIYQAYLISRWVWQKKIDIQKVLEIKEEKKVMSDTQMLEKVKMLNNLFGGEVKACNS